MALYAIADTHLSFGTDKPMDSFPGWSDYTVRLAANWRHLVEPQDTVVIAGDISWAMKFSECTADFAFLNDLPGQKILLKGNHDYWWTTANKMNAYLESRGLRYAPHPAQQLLLRGGLRHLRHPGLAVRCGGASRRKGDEPGR